MTTITISVDTEIEAKFRKAAEKEFRGKKGFLGDAVTEAMKSWLDGRRQEWISQRALEMLEKGHKFGKLLYKTREELYDRS